LRKEIFFLAEEKIFSCARKFIFVRIEIFLRAHGNFLPFGRKRFSFRRALFFPSKGKELSCSGKKIFQRWKNFRLPQGDFFPCGRKNLFERKELLLRAEAGRNEKPLA